MRLRTLALLLFSLGLFSCAPGRILLLPRPPSEVRKEPAPLPSERAPLPTPKPSSLPLPPPPAPPPPDYPKRYEEAIARTKEAIARKAWQTAIPAWTELEESPYRRDAVFHQGVLLQLAGDLDGAKRLYRKLADETPPHEPAAANLLGILLLLGEMEEARPLAARLLPAPPSPVPGMLPELQANLAALLAEEGKPEEATRLILSLQERGIGFPSLSWNLAVLAYRKGDAATARRLAGGLPPETASLWPVAASRVAWDPEGEGIPAIDNVPFAGRSMADLARNLRAYREYRRGDPAAAETILRESGGREQPPELITNLGILAAEQGNWETSRKALEEAVRVDPGLAAGWRNLGIFLEVFAGDPAAARSCYEKYGTTNGIDREEVGKWAEWLGRPAPSSP